MRLLALLFSLLMLGAGMFSLVTLDLLALSFNWEDFLFYLVVAAIVYVIVMAVGRSLNRSFEASVTQFLNGGREQLAYDRGSLRVFGLLLVVMLPFLIYLLLFALYSAATFTLYGLSIILQLPRIPIAILIGFAIIAIGTAIGILSGFYHLVFPPSQQSLGIVIKRSEHHALWELVRETADKLHAPPVDRILVTPDPGIGVYRSGSVIGAILGIGGRTLQLGLPSLYGLSVGEFAAVLAHEYAHFSHRDTQWGAFTYSMGMSLVSALRSTPGPTHGGRSNKGGLAQLVVSLNPAYWILYVFTSLYFQTTQGFSRVREVMADISAMDLYGGRVFGSALLKVAMNDLIYAAIVLGRYVPDLLQEGKTISDFSKSMEHAYQSMDDSTLESFRSEIMSRVRANSVYDSHPSVRTRLDYAQRFTTADWDDERSVTSLFDNWDEVNAVAAELYNQRLITVLRALNSGSRPSAQ